MCGGCPEQSYKALDFEVSFYKKAVSMLICISVFSPFLSFSCCFFSLHRFISERGSSRLLDHVEHMDKLHAVPPPPHTKEEREGAVAVLTLPTTPKFRYHSSSSVLMKA